MSNASSAIRRLGTRALVALAVALCCLLVPGRAAWAATEIDTSRTCSVTVTLADDAGAVSGATVRAWRVGDVSPAAELTLSGDFASYPVDLSDLDSSGWRHAAQTLAAYAERDNVPVTREGVTDATGSVRFADLATGLYLVDATAAAGEADSVEVEPALVMLPQLNAVDTLDYDAHVSLKFERVPTTGVTSVSVQKTWDDDGTERPEAIVAQLLDGGRVVDEVELSPANDWRHTWEGLDPTHSWSVIEKDAPEGYSVTVRRSGDLFTIVNAAPGPEPEGPLSRTGEPWNPAVPLAAIGLVLLLFGWYRWRRSARDEAEPHS